MTITQDDYINTAMHVGRPEASQTGQPLELNIVCLSPNDLKNEANDRLAPDADITSDIWYQNRPLPGDKVDSEEGHARFRLAKDHVCLLTDAKEHYGKRIGGCLQGAVIDKKKKISVRFPPPGGLHDDDAVIYVFPKFIDSKGQVLPVRPARFHPPGAYTEKLYIEIGVDKNRAHYGQYIDNVTERKLHGREDDD
ncbi:MAG: hypothetical protein ACYSUQ_03050 [Planctomycetota bacterium]|jgi:hypothetical protein